MTARGDRRWWIIGVALGVAVFALGGLLVWAGLEDADRWASVIGVFLNLAGLVVAGFSVAQARRMASGTGGLVIMGRDTRGVLPARPDGAEPSRRRFRPMNAPVPEVSNRISGVPFHAVIMGRDIQVVLSAEIPPALTGLPRPAAVFTGRNQQIQALLDDLRPGRSGGATLISAVAGMGGIGKTELVLHTADRALKQPSWFPGGVLFVDMFGYDAGRRLSAGDALLGWLQAMGIPGEHIPAGEQDRSRLWRSALDAYTRQGRRLLLIIDNASREDQVTPLLPVDRQIPVLVTSRHTLDIDARLHDLDVLDTAAAVTLIREVIANRRGAKDPRLSDSHGQPGLSDLADVCGGLPLALRLVAALLTDRPRLQPAALAGRLRNEQTRLDGLSRHQVAVRTAFDLSYQHLTNSEARLFRLLPVNPGSDIATAGAAALAGLPDDRAAVLLEGLHRAHLINEPSVNRWRMHDLIRLHAETRPSTAPDETAEARRRLFAYYQDSARAANIFLDPTLQHDDATPFTGRNQALAWLDAEHTNLIGVCTTHAHHLPATSADLALSLARFLNFRRYLNDWITVATTARDIYQQTGDQRGEARAWTNLGLALQQVRRFDEAINAQTRARELFRGLSDRHGEGRSWNNLGLALRYVRRFDEAITAHTHAREIFQELGDRHTEGTAWNNLGIALQQVRRFDDAINAHTHAREIFQELGDRQTEGTAWGNLGLALRKVGRFDEAISAHTRAREIFQMLGDRHSEGSAWNGLGLALAEVGRFDEAIDAHMRELEICQELGDRHSEGTASGSLGAALAEVGRFDEAIDAHTRELEICRELGDRHDEGSALIRLGLTLAEADRYDEAISAHTAARDILHQLGDRHGEGRALSNLGAALEELGQFDDARACWTAAVAAFSSAGDAKTAATVHEWLADLPPTAGQH